MAPENGWISTPAMQDDCLSADATGRAIMQDEFVNNAKLADDAVTTAKILDASITFAKFSSSKLLYTGVYGLSEYGRAIYG